MDTTQHTNPTEPIFADCDGTCQGVCADPDYTIRSNHNASFKRLTEALAIPAPLHNAFLISDNTPLTEDGKFAESNRRGILAKVFSRILDIAGPTVKHYRSDFYHDALWIERNIDGPMSFLLDFDNCGTWMWLINDDTPNPTRTHRWEITIRRGTSRYDTNVVSNYEWVMDARPLEVAK